MTTITHHDALGQPIKPGDFVWATSNSSRSRVRLVVRLTEARVMVDNRSPKEGSDLLVVTSLLDSINDTTIRAGLMAKFGTNIDHDVTIKPANLPLRFIVMANESKSDFVIVEVKGTSNVSAQKGAEVARTLLGDPHMRGYCMGKAPSCIYKQGKPSPHTYWHQQYLTNSNALLTLRELTTRGLAHFSTGVVMPIGQYANALAADDICNPFKQ